MGNTSHAKPPRGARSSVGGLLRRGSRALRSWVGGRSVATQVLLSQLVLVVLLVGAAIVVLVRQTEQSEIASARARTLAVAQTLEYSPSISLGLQSSYPTAALQPLATQIRRSTGVAYIVIYDNEGTRITHPERQLVGHYDVINPDLREALDGGTATSTFTGSVGSVVATSAPVLRADGSVVGAVLVGYPVAKVNQSVNRQLPPLLGAAAGALALSATVTGLVGRRLRRQTHGLGPAAMTQMYEHHDAVLHSVREGVLIIGPDGRVTLANDEATDLLGLPAHRTSQAVTELGLPPGITELLASGRPASDQVHTVRGRVLAVNVRTTASSRRRYGTVVTLRDTTELARVTGQAEAAHRRLRLLYDAGVYLGTTLDVVRTAEELTALTVPRFADFATVDLAGPVLHGDEPVEGRMQMQRVAIAAIRPDHPLRLPGARTTFVPSTTQGWQIHSRRPMVGAVMDEGPAWEAEEPDKAREVRAYGMHSVVTAQLRAGRRILGVVTFWRATGTEPFDKEDVALAEELAVRAALCIDNARRYTWQHGLTVSLQRSLLPRTLPRPSALEVARRYLPARTGAAGDWYDVMPLPGARVALVVGDVVGHGLHAAATMGRLRTAVRNFSSLDLPPDELLARLDDLVSVIEHDESSVPYRTTDAREAPVDAEDATATEPRHDATIVGARCLYAVYDQVSGILTMASAGQPGPALVRPDGTVEYLAAPSGPVLGVGGLLPYETVEFTLPADSALVLFTDGLIRGRDRDPDDGLALLRRVLVRSTGSPDAICAKIIEEVAPRSADDDIALLVARVNRIDPAHVAEWEVPREPSAVAPVRREVAAQLESWMPTGETFAAELILSELLTNAIRYGSEPIRVRLLYDAPTLICEVTDGSSTSPHLRYAEVQDEGGRGLFLVAQFAGRWGKRFGPTNKVIWAELTTGVPLDPDLFLTFDI